MGNSSPNYIPDHPPLARRVMFCGRVRAVDKLALGASERMFRAPDNGRDPDSSLGIRGLEAQKGH